MTNVAAVLFDGDGQVFAGEELALRNEAVIALPIIGDERLAGVAARTPRPSTVIRPAVTSKAAASSSPITASEVTDFPDPDSPTTQSVSPAWTERTCPAQWSPRCASAIWSAVDAEDLEDLRRMRATRMSMVFQEPMTALNPVETVGAQVEEVLKGPW